MTDRWSDLSLWPAKAEVSPLREEPMTTDTNWCTTHGKPLTECWNNAHAEEHAVARSTDPGTSWEAARSITPEKLRESQRAVLGALKLAGPSTDERIYRCLHESEYDITPSGARTRRSELVAMGLVRDSGRKDVLRSGRRAIVWEAV